MDDLDPPKKTGRTILIVLLSLLLLGTIGLYVSGISLKSLIYGITSGAGEKVAVVKTVTGQLKRQPKDSLEFLDSKVNDDLFNEDTVMTGPEDHATIELFDGSILELEPGSLVRLSFETSSGVGGIQRRVLVDIVAGNVKSDLAKPQLVLRRGGKPVARPTVAPTKIPQVQPTVAPTPEPTPSPTPEPTPSPTPSPTPEPPKTVQPGSLKVTQPNVGEVLVVPMGQTPPLKQAMVFEAPTTPSVRVLMLLRNSTGKEILRLPVRADKTGRGGILATFERPGSYQLEVRNSDGSKIGRGLVVPFTVAGEFPGIEAEAPLVGGEAIDSNRYAGKRLTEFDVVLRWKPLPEFNDYRVLVKSNAGKVLVDEKVQGTRYAFPKGKIYNEPLVYSIRAEYPNGYAAVSKPENFLFNFNSPALTLPADGTQISFAKMGKGKNSGQMFTWQRTTFTNSYEFEIALNPEFSPILKKAAVKDNFLFFRGLKPAQYYWRVRALNGKLKLKSPAGQPFKITVTP